jgi:hypothetical protein
MLSPRQAYGTRRLHRGDAQTERRAHPGIGNGAGFWEERRTWKNMIGVEFAHESLGNYSPGIGGTSLLACASGCPIPPFEITYSNSADFQVNLNYSRDFYHGSRFMVYGVAGGGYHRILLPLVQNLLSETGRKGQYNHVVWTPHD